MRPYAFLSFIPFAGLQRASLSSALKALTLSTVLVGCSVFEPPVRQCKQGDKNPCKLDQALGECTMGEQVCEQGYFADECTPVGQQLEVCDGKDNDCDSETDEAPEANESCALENAAQSECVSGVCALKSCEKSFGDCDGEPATGCEQPLVDNIDHCGICDESCQWECATDKCNEVQELSLGGAFSCARFSNLTVSCWGDNGKLQIGTTTPLSGIAPNAVVLSTSQLGGGASAISAGAAHVCTLNSEMTSAGVKKARAYCWGDNATAQLGNGMSGAPSASPDSNLSEASLIGVGPNHSCAARRASPSPQVVCWGLGTSGQLGDGAAVPSTSTIPVVVASLPPNLLALSLGNTHSCAAQDDLVNCWGDGSKGQLGNGATASTSKPGDAVIDVSGTALTPKDLAGRRDHTCAVNDKSKVYCWGDNLHGKLGYDPGTLSSEYALVVAGLPAGALNVAAGAQHTCARVGGRVFCWGDNSLGQLGTTLEDGATETSAPVLVGGISDARGVWAGDNHTCVTRTGTAISCWGDNSSGQLGSKTSATFSATPIDVAAPGVVAE